MAQSAIVNVMVSAARKAGRTLLRDFNELEKLQVSLKAPDSFAKAAIQRVATILLEELSRARPSFGFVINGRGEIRGSDHNNRFIVNPACGFANFSHGLALFATTICLQRQDKPVAAVIYNPALDTLYSAEAGVGAYFNDRRIRVSGRTRLDGCLIGADFEGTAQRVLAKELQLVLAQSAGVRCVDAPSICLAWVASGQLDGALTTLADVGELDAGMLLIREAGGVITGLSGSKTISAGTRVFAANSHIHRQFTGWYNQ